MARMADVFAVSLGRETSLLDETIITAGMGTSEALEILFSNIGFGIRALMSSDGDNSQIMQLKKWLLSDGESTLRKIDDEYWINGNNEYYDLIDYHNFSVISAVEGEDTDMMVSTVYSIIRNLVDDLMTRDALTLVQKKVDQRIECNCKRQRFDFSNMNGIPAVTTAGFSMYKGECAIC